MKFKLQNNQNLPFRISGTNASALFIIHWLKSGADWEHCFRYGAVISIDGYI